MLFQLPTGNWQRMTDDERMDKFHVIPNSNSIVILCKQDKVPVWAAECSAFKAYSGFQYLFYKPRVQPLLLFPASLILPWLIQYLQIHSNVQWMDFLLLC